MSASDINENVPGGGAKVFRTWNDGYSVRQMTPQDALIVQNWYLGMGMTSIYDLNVCLSVYPPGAGFYVGELDGEVVASAIRIPWGEHVFYGSYYYVAKEHRRKGFGTRVRDEVAREYVGDNILCVDAVVGKVAETNLQFGYVTGKFTTGRYAGPAKSDVGALHQGTIVPASQIPFDQLMEYDNKCFVSKDFPIRRAFMEKWINVPGGATLVALDNEHRVVGFGCRRPCLQEANHQVGPLYAESGSIAESLLQALCKDIPGCNITVNIWHANAAAVAMVKKFGLEKVFEVQRMHVNGDPDEYKDQVMILTSIDVCGF